MLRTLILAACLTACSIQSVPPKAAAQSPRYVVLDAHVRNTLAADWDAHASDSPVLERVYCVTYQKDLWVVDEWVWRVVEIEPATNVVGAGPSGVVSWKCPSGPNITIAHSHPFQSCLSGNDCVDGGILAGQCFPSDVDERFLRWTGQPFALIVCDRRTAVAYFAPKKS